MRLVDSALLAAEAVGPIVIALWRDEVTSEAVEEVGQLLRCTAEDYPEGIAFVTVAQFRAPIPSAAMRARIVEIYGELGDTLHGVAQVVEGTGFWASAALCFIAGLGLLHRHDHQLKVFGEAAEGLRWAAELGVPKAPTADELLTHFARRTLALELGRPGAVVPLARDSDPSVPQIARTGS